jgi:hypothetical protein
MNDARQSASTQNKQCFLAVEGSLIPYHGEKGLMFIDLAKKDVLDSRSGGTNGSTKGWSGSS